MKFLFYFKMDVEKLENVQRRFTKAIFPKPSYSERLLKLHLPTLEMRRLMADLTYLIQIVKWSN